MSTARGWTVRRLLLALSELDADAELLVPGGGVLDGLRINDVGAIELLGAEVVPGVLEVRVDPSAHVLEDLASIVRHVVSRLPDQMSGLQFDANHAYERAKKLARGEVL